MESSRRRVLGGVLAAAAAGTLAAAVGAAADGGENRGKAVFRGGMEGSLTTDATLNGVRPGGRDWDLRSGEARVSEDGVISVRVRGLVFTETGTTTAPGAAAPLAAVSASLRCGGQLVGALTPTAPLSAPDGDAVITGTVDLPATCVGPVVFVHPGANAGTYIAYTGFSR